DLGDRRHRRGRRLQPRRRQQRRREKLANRIRRLAAPGSDEHAQRGGALGVAATGGNSGPAALSATNPYGGPALALTTAGTTPPFKVTSAVRVKNLNADRLDNLDATDFYRAGVKVADSDSLDGQDSSAFLRANDKAGDADKLDGQDSTAFLPAD